MEQHGTRVRPGFQQAESVPLGEDRRLIAKAMDDLEAETRTFAALRMDKTIRKAMTGKRIDELDTDRPTVEEMGGKS